MSQKKQLFDLLNNFFDEIYVITLRRNEERHALIEDVLGGLKYRLFWGVDGRELKIAELHEEGLYHPQLTKLLRKRKGRRPINMTLNQIGCALSHVGVYKDMLEKKYEKVLVLEDDPIIDAGTVEILRNALPELPEDWELLYLGHHGSNSNPSPVLRLQKNLLSVVGKLVKKYERLRMIDPDVIDRWFPRPYSEHLDRSGSHLGAYSYGISAKGAEKMLNFQVPVVQEADNFLGELCSYGWLKAYNVKAQIFLPNREILSTVNNA